MIRQTAVMAVVLGWALLALGQATRPGAPAEAGGGTAAAVNSNALLAPYLDGQTFLVVHVDAAKIDTAAFEKFITEIMDTMQLPLDHDARAGLPAARLAADTFLARFKQLGGRHAYLVMSHADVWPNMEPLAVLLPVAPGGDPQMLCAFLSATFGQEPEFKAVTLKDNLVFFGQPAALDRLQTVKPVARPDLALIDGSAVALEAVAAPTADMRRAIAELLPRLPDQIGGDSTEFIGGLRNVRLTVTPPPAATLRVVFTATPSDTAPTTLAELTQTLDHLRDALLADTGLADMLNSPELKPSAADLRALIREILTPVPETGALALQIDDRQMRSAARLMAASMVQAKSRAARMVSMGNIKQILLACMLYANDHQGALPESLKTLVDAKLITAQMLINPNDPQHRPYEYRRWAAEVNKIPDPANTPLVWEVTAEGTNGLNVGFADGHVQFFQNRKELDALLIKAQTPGAQPDIKLP